MTCWPVPDLAPAVDERVHLVRNVRQRRTGRDVRQPIHLIGVEFSRATGNLTAFEVADA